MAAGVFPSGDCVKFFGRVYRCGEKYYLDTRGTPRRIYAVVGGELLGFEMDRGLVELPGEPELVIHWTYTITGWKWILIVSMKDGFHVIPDDVWYSIGLGRLHERLEGELGRRNADHIVRVIEEYLRK